jgi:hypothetical protein
MSKAHYTIDLGTGDGRLPFYGTHSGGETIVKPMEVFLNNLPATMVEVPSGAKEFMPLELELMDMPAEGLGLEDVIPVVIAWNSAGANEDLKTVIIQKWADADFTVETSKITLAQAWCKVYKLPEGDRKSAETRTMTMTITHRGSTFELGGTA